MDLETAPVSSADRLTFASWLGGLFIAVAFGGIFPMMVTFGWIIAYPAGGVSSLTHSWAMSAVVPLVSEVVFLLGGWLVRGRRIPLDSFGLNRRITARDLWFAFGFVVFNLSW
ncbi:MAG: hypothetical protein M0Z66_04090 [Thermaerobacter sp.]|nr:hypothetical protein [Thermaerobacter sp.]